MSVNSSKKHLDSWCFESRIPFPLIELYRSNSSQLNRLWQQMPKDTKSDSDAKSSFALAFLRLADVQSAKSVDPQTFDLNESGFFDAKWTHRLSAILAWSVVRRLWFIYLPIALFISIRCRRYTDAQLLLNMYAKVWANNTLGLRYILPLYARELIRTKTDQNSSRNICFFGYIAALNCILDDGIEIMTREIAILSRWQNNPIYDFWMLDIYLLNAMLYFYKI